MWFTEIDGNKIAKIDPTDLITEYPVTAGSRPETLVNGPDNNLWFTADARNKIGKMTKTGTVTEYSPLTANATPTKITTGPDGNLWFIEQSVGKIGKITTAGVVSEYPVSATVVMNDIVAGSDNALWFTEANVNKIGRMTTTGTVTHFPIPTANSSPNGIALAPDGSLWFTESTGNKIGKITPGGMVTEYPILSPNAGAGEIVVDSDGTIWFAESSLGKIGRMLPNGSMTEYIIPSTGPFQLAVDTITIGTNGNIWFTAYSGTTDVVGMLSCGATSGSASSVMCAQLFCDPPGPGCTVTGPAPVDANGCHTACAPMTCAQQSQEAILGAACFIDEEYSLKTPDFIPGNMIIGPDNNLWFTEKSSGQPTVGRIGTMTLTGEASDFLLRTQGNTPIDIVKGLDTIWYTEQGTPNVAKITTAGVSTEYATPSSSADPTGIAVTSDGTVWFTQPTLNKIAKMTPAGSVSEFTPPTAGAAPTSITVGPDGNIWFVESGINKIAQLTISTGKITEFSSSGSVISPARIIGGPDGNLWFTDLGNRLGKMTTTGQASLFPLLTPGSINDQTIITFAPDNTIWFAEANGMFLANMSTTGQVTRYPFSAESTSIGTVLKMPDGSLRFVDKGAKKIGKAVCTMTTSAGSSAQPTVTSSVNTAGTFTATGPDGSVAKAGETLYVQFGSPFVLDWDHSGTPGNDCVNLTNVGKDWSPKTAKGSRTIKDANGRSHTYYLECLDNTIQWINVVFYKPKDGPIVNEALPIGGLPPTSFRVFGPQGQVANAGGTIIVNAEDDPIVTFEWNHTELGRDSVCSGTEGLKGLPYSYGIEGVAVGSAPKTITFRLTCGSTRNRVTQQVYVDIRSTSSSVPTVASSSLDRGENSVASAPTLGAACGNGSYDDGELCDDANSRNGDGCTALCMIEAGYQCFGTPSVCTPICGDGMKRPGEDCDDRNTNDGDGCSGSCTVEPGWTCQSIACQPICGDGLLRGSELCDDGNNRDGDGCAFGCGIEKGYLCSGEPSQCVFVNYQFENTSSSEDYFSEIYGNKPGESSVSSAPVFRPVLEVSSAPARSAGEVFGETVVINGVVQQVQTSSQKSRYYIPVTCGNSIVDPEEVCDRGDANADTPGALCRKNCQLARCGDGIIDAPFEQCDDGSLNADTLTATCSAACRILSPAVMSSAASVAGQSIEQNGYQVTLYPAASHSPVGSTGPGALAVMAGGAAAGIGWARRKRKV